MAKLKAEELTGLAGDELKEKWTALKKELFELRAQSKVGKLERHTLIREVRKNIARVLTVIHQKEKEKEPTQPPAEGAKR